MPKSETTNSQAVVHFFEIYCNKGFLLYFFLCLFYLFIDHRLDETLREIMQHRLDEAIMETGKKKYIDSSE